MAQILVFEGTRCPDGVEFRSYAKHPNHLMRAASRGEYFSPRTHRTAVHVTNHDIKNPVVMEFINSVTEDEITSFFGKYGLPSMHSGSLVEGDGCEQIHELQQTMKELAKSIEGGEQEKVSKYLNEKFGTEAGMNLSPCLSFQKGKAVLELKASTLQAFMAMELMLMAAGNVRLTNCQHCAEFFVTGPGTGRTERADFCSPRCRVAASRARRAMECAATA